MSIYYLIGCIGQFLFIFTSLLEHFTLAEFNQERATVTTNIVLYSYNKYNKNNIQLQMIRMYVYYKLRCFDTYSSINMKHIIYGSSLDLEKR